MRALNPIKPEAAARPWGYGLDVRRLDFGDHAGIVTRISMNGKVFF